MAPKEVKSHGHPARANCYQSAAHIVRGERGREVCAERVPERVDLTQGPDGNQELDRDSDLSPTFSGHTEIVACS